MLTLGVVVLSYVTLVATFLPSGVGRTLRVARTVRPLRMINKSERIKLIFEVPPPPSSRMPPS